MSDSFYTIGHSTRPIGEFIGLLRQVEVQTVIDVRTVPRSRTNSHYNHDVLPETLSAYHIGYEHIVALGGPVRVNAFTTFIRCAREIS